MEKVAFLFRTKRPNWFRVMGSWSFRRGELFFLVAYASVFYAIYVRQSFQLARDHSAHLHGLRPGWMFGRRNDVSDPQWRNFRGNLLILTVVMGVFTAIANSLRHIYNLKSRGMSFIWILTSLGYLVYLHEACVGYILAIALLNFLMAKILAGTRYYLSILWLFNLAILVINRVYEGYSFSFFGDHFAFLDNYRGTFRWHICFNLVVLRIISFGCDYHWSYRRPLFDPEVNSSFKLNPASVFSMQKHMQHCKVCCDDKSCYHALQEVGLSNDKYSFSVYLCYLIYAPLYIAGPIVSFNAFARQLDTPQKNYSYGQIAFYGIRWICCLFLMEVITHLFYYNAFAISGSWRHLSPFEIFIVGYGVFNFMWLKFYLIWRYFRFWSLTAGVETPENMPRCLNNCCDLETFWRSWHASYNKWIVRYMYIPLGGSHTKILNMWVIFTFVAIWHDLEWKLLHWAWLTCVFFALEMSIKSLISGLQVPGSLGEYIRYELHAIAGAITITCLMVANLVGYVIGSSGFSWLTSRLQQKDGLPFLAFIFITFYVGTKLMFHIRDVKRGNQRKDQ